MNDSKLYVPDYSSIKYPCVVVRDSNTIRAYKQTPYNPPYNQIVDIPFVDFYLNSNYIYTENTQRFSNNTSLPICLSSSNLTDNYYHRNDLDSILIVFVIFCFFALYIPFKVIMRLFKKGGF